MYDLVGRCFWFTPGFQCVLNGDTIILQARSVIDHIKQASQQDPELIDRFQDHLSGTYLVIWSMMDTTAFVNNEWNIRSLRDHECDAVEESVKALS